MSATVRCGARGPHAWLAFVFHFHRGVLVNTTLPKVKEKGWSILFSYYFFTVHDWVFFFSSNLEYLKELLIFNFSRCPWSVFFFVCSIFQFNRNLYQKRYFNWNLTSKSAMCLVFLLRWELLHSSHVVWRKIHSRFACLLLNLFHNLLNNLIN